MRHSTKWKHHSVITVSTQNLIKCWVVVWKMVLMLKTDTRNQLKAFNIWIPRRPFDTMDQHGRTDNKWWMETPYEHQLGTCCMMLCGISLLKMVSIFHSSQCQSSQAGFLHSTTVLSNFNGKRVYHWSIQFNLCL